MAPRNKAKRQQGSFLTRGRQQVQRRQQLRQQSSRQLPPQGGTSAGSPKATAQRVTKAVTERARMDVARTRALGDMLQRNAARNARAEGVREGSRMTSGRTRYVPPGGENARGQASLPQGRRGGDMRQRGGPLATTQRGGEMTQRGGGVIRTNTGGPVNRVRVRDMGNSNPRQLPGQRGLPGGTGGADRVRGSGTRTGQSGPNRPSLPQGNRGGDLTTRTRPSLRGGLAAGLTYAAGQAAISPMARAGGRMLADALRPVGRAIDDRMKGTNSRDEAQRIQRATPKPQMTPAQNARAVRLGQASPSDVGRRSNPTPTSGGSRSQTMRQRSSTASSVGSNSQRTGTQSDTLRIGSTPQAPTERRVSASTANRESGNYGTSGTNNKLIDTWMRERMRQRESAANEAAMTDAEKSKLAEINKKKKEQKK